MWIMIVLTLNVRSWGVERLLVASVWCLFRKTKKTMPIWAKQIVTLWPWTLLMTMAGAKTHPAKYLPSSCQTVNRNRFSSFSCSHRIITNLIARSLEVPSSWNLIIIQSWKCLLKWEQGFLELASKKYEVSPMYQLWGNHFCVEKNNSDRKKKYTVHFYMRVTFNLQSPERNAWQTWQTPS